MAKKEQNSTKLPALFLSHDIYYFKISVENPKFGLFPDEPRKIRITVSTRTSNRKDAEKFQAAFIKYGTRRPVELISNLSDIIMLFSSPETNPKLKEAQIEGRSYSRSYAKNVARDCRHLMEVLTKKLPYLLTCKLADISRRDGVMVREMLYDEYGRTHVSAEAFKKFKMCLTYAADQGYIASSPVERITNIKPEDPKPIFILSPEDVVLLCSCEELFKSKLARDQFYVFATTGMRRSELAALTVQQIYKYQKTERIGGKLVFKEGYAISIDRAFKNDGVKEVGLPKWNKTRCIPIADSTYRTLKPYLENKAPSDRVFETITHHTLLEDFAYLKKSCDEHGIANLLSCPAAIENLSPHKLRHSLNTFLTASTDIKDTLTNEYMSWAKQRKDNVAKMQSHYTHINVNHLSIVADAIENAYCDEVDANLIPFTVNG